MKTYKDFMIFEKFDKNIRAELIRLGITGKEELNHGIKSAKKGNLAEYIRQRGGKFTFGLLDAIFKDALIAKKSTDMTIGIYKMVHRIVPILLAPYYPVLAIIGYVLGTSRALNKILIPIITEPGTDYPNFLKRIINAGITISEGELSMKDRFSRAFVVSDDLVSSIKPEVIHRFSIYLSNKMSHTDPSLEVPDHYVENELKEYLNIEFKVNPKIPFNKK